MVRIRAVQTVEVKLGVMSTAPVGALVRYFLHVLNGAIQCNIFGLPNFPSDNQNWQTGCPKDNHENFLKYSLVIRVVFSWRSKVIWGQQRSKPENI